MEGESTKQLTKDFGAVLKDLTKAFHGLIALNTQLAKAGSGAVLSIPSEEGTVQFGKKELRQANSSFVELLGSLKQYIRAARKKDRKAVNPSSFKGVYTPVYVGDALRVFFTEANFGSSDPSTGSSTRLIDSLTLVQSGYMLRNTITMLFYIHAYSESLQDSANAQLTRSSDVMLKAFDGSIPAEVYIQKDKDESGNVLKSTKMRMVDFVAQGGTNMNTYSVIKGSYPEFDSSHFKTYFFQNIASVNYYSIKDLRQDADLSQAADILEQENVRTQMLTEHQLVKDVSTSWSVIREAERATKKGITCP